MQKSCDCCVRIRVCVCVEVGVVIVLLVCCVIVRNCPEWLLLVEIGNAEEDTAALNVGRKASASMIVPPRWSHCRSNNDNRSGSPTIRTTIAEVIFIAVLRRSVEDILPIFFLRLLLRKTIDAHQIKQGLLLVVCCCYSSCWDGICFLDVSFVQHILPNRFSTYLF